MKTIWKWQLNEAVNTVEMPADAEILYPGCQDGKMYIYALVDSDQGAVKNRKILCVGTGGDLTKMAGYRWKSIGKIDYKHSTSAFGGFTQDWVFHVFEVFE